jgi:repressor LexA
MNEKQTPALPPINHQLQTTNSPTVRPTKKQKELLAYIEQFIAEHGYSPSYREIMKGLNYTSVATVALHVGNLIKRGHLIKRDHSARSLEVVSPSTKQAATLSTNEVKDAEEKWLVNKIDKLFTEAEAEALPTAHQLEDIAVLLAALRVLGLEGAAYSFVERLHKLRFKIGDK